MADRGRIWLGLLLPLVWVAYALAVEVNPPLATGTLVIAGRVMLAMELARTAEEQVRGLSGRSGQATLP